MREELSIEAMERKVEDYIWISTKHKVRIDIQYHAKAYPRQMQPGILKRQLLLLNLAYNETL